MLPQCFPNASVHIARLHPPYHVFIHSSGSIFSLSHFLLPIDFLLCGVPRNMSCVVSSIMGHLTDTSQSSSISRSVIWPLIASCVCPTKASLLSPPPLFISMSIVRPNGQHVSDLFVVLWPCAWTYLPILSDSVVPVPVDYSFICLCGCVIVSSPSQYPHTSVRSPSSIPIHSPSYLSFSPTLSALMDGSIIFGYGIIVLFAEAILF